jgi:hypothetical protein
MAGMSIEDNGKVLKKHQTQDNVLVFGGIYMAA